MEEFIILFLGGDFTSRAVIREESVIDGVNGSDADTEGAKKVF